MTTTKRFILSITDENELVVAPLISTMDLPERFRRNLKDELYEEIEEEIKKDVLNDVQIGVDGFIQEIEGEVQNVIDAANTLETTLDNGFDVRDAV